MNHVRKYMVTIFVCGMVMTVPGCGRESDIKEAGSKMNIVKQEFGKTEEGITVLLYTLTKDNGVEAKITSYGGIVVSLLVPDRNGKLDDLLQATTSTILIFNLPFYNNKGTATTNIVRMTRNRIHCWKVIFFTLIHY